MFRAAALLAWCSQAAAGSSPPIVFTAADKAGAWDCLTATAAAAAPSTRYCSTTGGGQHWSVHGALAAGGGPIIEASTRRCLALPKCTRCKAALEPCDPASAAQRWSAENASGGSGEVHLAATSAGGTKQCLTRDEGEGRAAQVWSCDGIARQKWSVGAGPPPAPAATGCSDDLGCSLNGVCDAAARVCACDAAWGGAHCGELRLLPAASEAATHALRVEGASSWGGSVARDRATGKYHMLAAFMEGGCGLKSYTHNSAVVHAVSDAPAGPYVLASSGVSGGGGGVGGGGGSDSVNASRVVPPFAHNPTLVQAPNGSWVLYHIGCGAGQKSLISGCRNGTTPVQARARARARAAPYHCSGGYGDPPNVYVTEDLERGPWRMHGLAVRTTEWMSHMDNPAPVLHPNGSVLLLARKWAKTSSTIGVVRAPRWDADGSGGAADVYTLPAAKLNFPHSVEDPFLWVDARGGLGC